MAEAKLDQNSRPALTAVSSADGQTVIRLYADPATHRLLVEDTSGGGITLIDVAGTINDSNVDFTAGSEPTVLVINSGTYRQAGGSITWTYVAGNITLSAPVGTGGSIFGMA